MPRFPAGGLRFRIALAFFLGALVVSGAVAGSTYALSQTFLTRQRTDSVVRQSYNSIRFANEYLARPSGERSLDQLVSFLQARGTSDVLVIDGDLPVSSSVSLTEQSIPAGLRELVAQEGVGWMTYEQGMRRLAFGSPIPNTSLDVFLVYPLDTLDQTLGVLARILLGVVGGAVLVAGILGFRLADRTIQPLRRTADAAQRVAEGSLQTRLEERGRDELGLLAGSFNRMTEALTERIARERRFVADASHELRTPLTALKTSVEFIEDRADDLPPRLGTAAQMAADEVRSLQRLVDDLLELSRVEAGGVHVAWEDLDLSDFARQITRRRAAGVPVRIDVPEHCVVRTDKARLERVVGNLLENAVVHGNGKDVVLEVDRRDGEARIVVSDRGPGIRSEQLGQVFERFWRADQARRRGGRAGAGLGLAIARENAHVIGAELDVRSTPGDGTRFQVRLPLDGDVARNQS